MSSIKTEAIKMIDALPESCTWEDVQYHIYVREKALRGMTAIDQGHIVTQPAAEERVKDWLKSSGRPQP
jgi:hypothetical protein